MARIAIYKYGVGNIHSVRSALERLGVQASVLESMEGGLGEYDALILPGVGNFGAAARRLEGSGNIVREFAGEGRPILGICLGMQLLYERSDEAPLKRGLGMIGGWVRRMPVRKLPHIGWSRVWPRGDSELLENVRGGEYFYFVHSYAVMDVSSPHVLAWSEYEGARFASVVEAPPLYGTQFHPERSGKAGRRVLENFVRLVRR